MRREIGSCYVLEVDITATEKAYERMQLILEDCTCDGCKNYVQAAKLLPEAVNAFFKSLGVDIKKSPEVFTLYAPDKNHVRYGGFYHICGKILSAESEWFSICDDFNVAFRDKCDLLPIGFPLPCFQMEIDARIPWIIEAENELWLFAPEK